MAQMLDHIEYLSREIGARPAGTEEEQEAALYIADQFQQEAGFHAEIEEFTSSSNLEGFRAIPAAIIILAVVIAIIVNAFTIPALIITLLAGALYALEAFDKPIISRFLARGASQNVVAKYQPFSADAPLSEKRGRARKVILVAHYDTGKVKPGIINTLESTGLPLGYIVLGGMGLTALLLIFRIFMGGSGDLSTVVLNIIAILALIVVAYPVLKTILNRMAPYNEGANNNASGVAALIEAARVISLGSVNEADYVEPVGDPVMHGRDAMMESGLVPEGVQLTYEQEEVDYYDEADDLSEEDRLLAAKAAIAALTGSSVENRLYVDPAELSRDADNPVVETSTYEPEYAAPSEPEYKAQSISYPIPAPTTLAQPVPVEEEPDTRGFQNAPSWFIAAQRNARKSTTEVTDDQRSRYNYAIDSAERAMAERDRRREEEERARQEAERRRREEETRAAMSRAYAKQVEKKEETPQIPAPVVPEEPEETPVLEVKPVEMQASEEAPVKAEQPELTGFDIMVDENDEAVAEPDADVAKPGSTVAFAPIHFSDDFKFNDEESWSAADSATLVDELEDNVEETDGAQDASIDQLEEDIQASEAALDVEENKEDISNKKIRSLPSIDVADDAETKSEGKSRSGMIRSLRENVPSLSGSNAPVKTNEKARARVRTLPSLSEEKADQESVNYDMDLESLAAEDGKQDASKDSKRTWQGGAFSRIHLNHVNTRSSEDADSDIPEELVESEEDRILNEEIGQIMHFRNPEFDTEVWFVAIGSDTDLHDGAKAFVEEHKSELRGSMIIEVESLGAGVLSVATEEGLFKKTKASSRVKRFTKLATEATGIALDSIPLHGADSITTTVQKAGFQAMHLFGAENGRPALKGSADDVSENVDELTLEDNLSFVLELLKQD